MKVQNVKSNYQNHNKCENKQSFKAVFRVISRAKPSDCNHLPLWGCRRGQQLVREDLRDSDLLSKVILTITPKEIFVETKDDYAVRMALKNNSYHVDEVPVQTLAIKSGKGKTGLNSLKSLFNQKKYTIGIKIPSFREAWCNLRIRVKRPRKK